MEEFDVIEKSGAIRTFKARVDDITDIVRPEGAQYTDASVKLLVQDEKYVLDPHEGISYLLSDFDLSDLRRAVEETLHAEGWEPRLYSDPG